MCSALISNPSETPQLKGIYITCIGYCFGSGDLLDASRYELQIVNEFIRNNTIEISPSNSVIEEYQYQQK